MYSLMWLFPIVVAVLRFPDGPWNDRWPQTIEDCESETETSCLDALRANIEEDLQCSKIVPEPNTYKLPQADIDIMSFSCEAFVQLVFNLFDASNEDAMNIVWMQFSASLGPIFSMDDARLPRYGNTTKEIVIRHYNEMLSVQEHTDPIAGAIAAARRASLFLENMSMTALVNWLLWNLEKYENSEEMIATFFTVDKTKYTFHDIGLQRWDVLCYMIDRLMNSHAPSGSESINMAEIGVATANVSRRLLDTYPGLSWVGIDPYGNQKGKKNGDETYAWVQEKISRYQGAKLIRGLSSDAVAEFPNESFHLVFLDAMHDFGSVHDDIEHWRFKVKKGGILSGHDWQWQYPGLPMAVSQQAKALNVSIHLSVDGMWWFEM
eukprot:GEMP01032765.1.p1 GENE.GEMP01032765.1~~GEMP01032765.1.p1  ORF type:complete len:378 (+),score=71.70 GEMP01032765.1:322-1455(+)